MRTALKVLLIIVLFKHSALEINPKFVKALDRRSRVLENFDRTEDSLVDAVAAAVIDEFKTESLFVHIEELLKKISETQAKSHYGVGARDFQLIR